MLEDCKAVKQIAAGEIDFYFTSVLNTGKVIAVVSRKRVAINFEVTIECCVCLRCYVDNGELYLWGDRVYTRPFTRSLCSRTAKW